MSSSDYAPPTDVDRHEFYIAFGFYLAAVIAIAFHEYNKAHWTKDKKLATLTEENQRRYSFQEHFLGNKTFTAIPLFLTLFSSIFSGYTIVGVVGMAAGPAGFISLIWLTSAPIVSLSFLILSPRLYNLSRKRHYDSATDFIMDRFNDRILQWVICLVLAAQAVVYLVTQFYTINRLVPVITNHEMHPEVTTWFLAAIMWVSEAVGGFHAVSKTDAIQSAIMLVALIAVPCVAHYYYGGAAESTDFGCENLVTINCTGPEFDGTPCSGSPSFEIGCAAQIGQHPLLGYTNGYKVLYPNRDHWSDYFSGPVMTPAGQADVSSFTKGIDSNEAFNQVAAYMLGFNLLFFAFSLNPHWNQRTLCAKTANSIKYAGMTLNLATLVSTLPGILLGTMIAGNLLPIRAEGDEPYGILLSEFMNKEDFTEFVAVLGAVSVFAAIMSTVDSAMNGITNILSSDFLKNYLFVKKPEWGTKSNMKNASRCISLIFLCIACAIALYEDDLTDPAKQDDVYARLISWQNALLWQAVPTYYLGLYQSKCKPWAHIVGLVVGFAFIFGFQIHQDSQYNWGSSYSIDKENREETPDAKTWYFAYGAGLWGGLANLLVTMLLNMLPGVEAPIIAISTEATQHGSSTLTSADVKEIMKGTTEPIKSKIGICCMISTFLLCNLCLPWYHDSYDNCNIVTLTQWVQGNGNQVGDCDGPEIVNGLPQWVVAIISCYVLAICSNILAYTQWKPAAEFNEVAGGDKYYGEESTIDQEAKGDTVVPVVEAVKVSSV